MSIYDDTKFKRMIGRKIAEVSLSPDRDIFTVTFEDGGAEMFGVEGDCCSHSWVEHLEVPNDVAGATIVEIKDGAPVTQDHDAHDEENGGDSIQVYNTSLKTTRGEIILEYRNSSNGFYGGSLTDEGFVPTFAERVSAAVDVVVKGGSIHDLDPAVQVAVDAALQDRVP